MIALLKLGGAVGLGLTVAPAMLVALGRLDLSANRAAMLAGMLLWFGCALGVARLSRRR